MNLPHCIAAEEIVLGTLIIDSGKMTQVAGVLHPMHFYDKLNGQLFDLMYSLFDTNIPIDIATIAGIAVKSGIFSNKKEARHYLFRLVNSVINPSAIDDYAKIIIEKHSRRVTE